MTIRAALFDFGGTLYDYATLAERADASLLQLARWAGVEEDPERVRAEHRRVMRRVFSTYLAKPFYLHRDLFEEGLRGTIDALGGAADSALLERYREHQWRGHADSFRLRPGVIETLAALRERGLHLGMVSNIDEDQLEFLLDVAQVRPSFDSILSSERAMSCKPDPAIFEQALGRARCAPAEALFVGDSRPADVAGANQAGMRSVLLWNRRDTDPPDAEPRARHVIRTFPEILALVD